MIDFTRLREYLNLFVEFTIEDAQAVFSLTKKKTLKAGETLVNSGDMYRKLCYVKTGLMRAYMINERGEEQTLFFRLEDQHIAPYDCIFENKPSRFFIEAFEDTVIYEVDYDVLQKFLERHPRYEKARKYFLQKILMETLLKVETFILLTPKERYIKFVKDNPLLAQRVPDKYIASALGITPVSLSRIRKRIKHTK
jgi:CRP-like cAMP-binding protein